MSHRRRALKLSGPSLKHKWPTNSKGPAAAFPGNLTSQVGTPGPARPRPSPRPQGATPPDPGALAFPPHRGTRQDKDGFLSRERYVRVRLHQSLHSGQRQPGEPSPGCSRRGLGLRSRGLPSGSLLLSGRPAPSRRRRHPHPGRTACYRRLSAHTRRRPLSRAGRRPRPSVWACLSLPTPETPSLGLGSGVAFRAVAAWKRPGVAWRSRKSGCLTRASVGAGRLTLSWPGVTICVTTCFRWTGTFDGQKREKFSPG